MFNISMEATIKANKPFAKALAEKKFELPTIGGFEMISKGIIYHFDFENAEYCINDEDDTIDFLLKCPDTDSFPDTEKFIEDEAYKKIDAIEDFYIEQYLEPIQGESPVLFHVEKIIFFVPTEQDECGEVEYPVSDEVIKFYNKQQREWSEFFNKIGLSSDEIINKREEQLAARLKICKI